MQLPAGFRIVHQATDADEAVWELVRRIPPGRVASYGRLAEWLGWQRSARIVGRAMARSPGGVPAHRVVDVRGRLVPGWEREQAQRLRVEGVAVLAGHVRQPIPWWEGPVSSGTRPARSSG
jgi:methylated-DNA-protein-cysteine methyltransferase related protein